MEISSRGRYTRNTVDIILDWSDICSTVDIPKLGERDGEHYERSA